MQAALLPVCMACFHTKLVQQPFSLGDKSWNEVHSAAQAALPPVCMAFDHHGNKLWKQFHSSAMQASLPLVCAACFPTEFGRHPFSKCNKLRTVSLPAATKPAHPNNPRSSGAQAALPPVCTAFNHHGKEIVEGVSVPIATKLAHPNNPCSSAMQAALPPVFMASNHHRK
ncbi:hypothetical protein EDD15DRAFT_2202270 [Pisolithus albus]|nr:hypothetical protein EDD15DRAFT_2202270 [Pisolithus albus]